MRIQAKCRERVADYAGHIEFVASVLGKSGAMRLERLGTAYFVSQRAEEGAGVEERAVEVTRRKPHIALDEARSAVMWADEVKEQARTIR